MELFSFLFMILRKKDDFKRQKDSGGKDNNAQKDYENRLYVPHDISHRFFHFHRRLYIHNCVFTLKINIITIKLISINVFRK